MNKKNIFTEDEMIEAIRTAFITGENWGVTYYTWFTPSPEDQQTHINDATTAIIGNILNFRKINR
jgi:hypothetical protein